MKALTHWLVAFSLVVVAAAADAQAPDMKALVAAMKQGGYVIVFRHGATNRDQADTDPLNHDNVSKQRLLSEGGRELARQVGESFKALNIPIGKVYTSKFNRAVETGRLIGGTEVTPSLDFTEG